MSGDGLVTAPFSLQFRETVDAQGMRQWECRLAPLEHVKLVAPDLKEYLLGSISAKVVDADERIRERFTALMLDALVTTSRAVFGCVPQRYTVIDEHGERELPGPGDARH